MNFFELLGLLIAIAALYGLSSFVARLTGVPTLFVFVSLAILGAATFWLVAGWFDKRRERMQPKTPVDPHRLDRNGTRDQNDS